MAEQIAKDLEVHGGLVTQEDLKKFKVTIGEPLRGTYRGYTVATSPPPGGGITLVEILNILEGHDLRELGFNTVDYIHIVTQAMKAGVADRNKFVGDPAFVDVPVDRLLSKEHAKRWKDKMDRREEFHVGFDRSGGASGTAHLSIVDNGGNCVSLTHSLGYCSGVGNPGLGFLYNNFMIGFDPVPGGPNSIAPGKSRVNAGCPTIVLEREEPFMILGAPGGSWIIGAVLQTLLNVVDHGMTVLEAVSTPRFDWHGEIVFVERRVPRWVCEELEERGHQVSRDLASYSPYPARAAKVHALFVDRERRLLKGAADPRGYGVALSA